jgi:hypothetical protein
MDIHRVGMNPMPSKVIGKEACLWVKSLLGLSKDLGPKKHPNTSRKKEFKKKQRNL